jgi:hypothetical protein
MQCATLAVALLTDGGKHLLAPVARVERLVVQPSVETTTLQERGVRAALDDAPVIHHQDLVGCEDR